MRFIKVLVFLLLVSTFTGCGIKAGTQVANGLGGLQFADAGQTPATTGPTTTGSTTTGAQVPPDTIYHGNEKYDVDCVVMLRDQSQTRLSCAVLYTAPELGTTEAVHVLSGSVVISLMSTIVRLPIEVVSLADGRVEFEVPNNYIQDPTAFSFALQAQAVDGGAYEWAVGPMSLLP